MAEDTYRAHSVKVMETIFRGVEIMVATKATRAMEDSTSRGKVAVLTYHVTHSKELRCEQKI